MKKKKIFLISSELPWIHGGSSSRNFNIFKFLDKKQFSFSLFTIINKTTSKTLPSVTKNLDIPIYKVNQPTLSQLQQLYYIFTQKVIPYMKEYELSGIDKLLLQQIDKQNPDIIHIAHLNAYYAIRKLIPYIKKRKIKIILDQHNVEYVAFSEGIKSMPFLKKLMGKILLTNLRTIENEAINNADYIFTCSDIDRMYFEKKVNPKKVVLVPNGVDCDYFKPVEYQEKNTLLFMGGTSYPPNNEGLKFFFSKIHPKLKNSMEGYSIYILGAKPSKWLVDLSEKDSSILLKGYVPDVRKYIAKAKICICPIQSGSGTRLKILEYLASGKAVISTKKGAEGINITDEKNIIIGDTANQFANKIISLHNESHVIKSLGKKGRKLITTQYQWSNIVKIIEKKYIN